MSVAHDPANLAMFLFSAVFMDTAATIPTGALAERWRFASFIAYGLFMSMFLYPLFANWVWGGGWLGSLGANFGMGHGMVDFAGSSVVHMTGGVTALAGVLSLGPRIGKFRKDGTITMIQGHNLPMAVIGTLILGVRLVRVQRRVDALGHRASHRRDRDEHGDRLGDGRRSRRSATCGSGIAGRTSRWHATASSGASSRSLRRARSSRRRRPP